MQAKRRLLFVVSLLLVFCVAVAIASPAQEGFTTLVNFDGNNGSNPFSPLMQARDGNLYGTTQGNFTYDGNNYNGTVFRMTPSGFLTTLYRFCSQPNCTDGSGPVGGLVQATDGNIYGITEGGGANNYGTVYKITPSGTLTTLYNFCSQPNCADGDEPNALVRGNDGNFYGTTYGGYPYPGTVFKITPGGTLTTIHSFCSQPNCADGRLPSSLVQATDGNFYGTTVGAANGAAGTVFKITPTGILTTLFSFPSNFPYPLGIEPNGLMQASDGNFYGTTPFGGQNCLDLEICGTVFRITPTGQFTSLYTFCSQGNCTDGYYPRAVPVQASDGYLYGTTIAGGNPNDCVLSDGFGCGTVFRITPQGVLTTLHRFEIGRASCRERV